MNLETIGGISLSLDFAAAFLSIVCIDLVLAGDNAVIIALAVRCLPPRQRFRGILLGAGAAVVMRVALTFVAAQLLALPYLKLAGGALIAVIAVRLLAEDTPAEAATRECKTLYQAMATIAVADLVMSTDNILAVAGASGGSLALLLFGLGLSIPLVAFAADFLSRLMDRFPAVILIGAAVLGKVAAEMILTDAWVQRHLAPSQALLYVSEGLAAAAVVGIGKLWPVLARSR